MKDLRPKSDFLDPLVQHRPFERHPHPPSSVLDVWIASRVNVSKIQNILRSYSLWMGGVGGVLDSDTDFEKQKKMRL